MPLMPRFHTGSFRHTVTSYYFSIIDSYIHSSSSLSTTLLALFPTLATLVGAFFGLGSEALGEDDEGFVAVWVADLTIFLPDTRSSSSGNSSSIASKSILSCETQKLVVVLIFCATTAGDPGDGKEGRERRSSSTAMVVACGFVFSRRIPFRICSASPSSMKLSLSSYCPTELLRMVPLEGAGKLKAWTLAFDFVRESSRSESAPNSSRAAAVSSDT